MDMCSRPGIVEEIIEQLGKMGYHAPLVLYSSKIDYTAISNLPDYVVHAKKPYIPDPLPEYLKLGDANVTGHVVTVQIHKNTILNSIPKDSIMYATEEEHGSRLYQLDGKYEDVDETISELRGLLEPYEEFERINKKSIANFKFVSAIMPFTVVMQDYRQLKTSPFRYREYKWLKEDMDK